MKEKKINKDPVPYMLLPAICATAFIVFAQTFMVAPIIPHLSVVLSSPVNIVALAIPAYILPQGIMTLMAGPLSDRFGRRTVIYSSVFLFTILTALTPLVNSADSFIGIRIATGFAGSGIVPICLTLIGDVIPFQKRGKAVGWMFGAIAGGTATGAAAGALLEPVTGWHGLFFAASILAALILIFSLSTAAFPHLQLPEKPASVKEILPNYKFLLLQSRAQRTYGYIFLNAVLQSGIFTWLGVYLNRRFGLNETGIGLALLGYGIPGLLFGPLIGKLADRYGRALIVPTGVCLTGICAMILAFPIKLIFVQLAIIFLSLGFDLTHPQLAAISTDLKGPRGQSVALTALCLFVGFGIGSLLFEVSLSGGFPFAFGLFGGVGLLASLIALQLFRSEQPGLKNIEVVK